MKPIAVQKSLVALAALLALMFNVACSRTPADRIERALNDCAHISKEASALRWDTADYIADRSKSTAQVVPRATQCLAKQGSDFDGGIVAPCFDKLQVAHRYLGLLGQRLLGQARGGTQPAHVLTEKISSCGGHRLNSEPSKPFDSEAYFVFFCRMPTPPVIAAIAPAFLQCPDARRGKKLEIDPVVSPIATA